MEGKTSPGSRGLTNVDELSDSGRYADVIGPCRPRAAARVSVRSAARVSMRRLLGGAEAPNIGCEVAHSGLGAAGVCNGP